MSELCKLPIDIFSNVCYYFHVIRNYFEDKKMKRHYDNVGSRISNQTKKSESYRFWFEGKCYQASDKEAADWKLSLGMKVEKLVDGNWVEYK